jgi:hypothetical protein
MGLRQRAVAAVKEGAAWMQLLPRSQSGGRAHRGSERGKANEPEAQYDVAFLDEDSIYLLAFHRTEANQ